ncbi:MULTISPECIES: polysaccharide biosynthesis protein [Oceanobacillus]|uniref:putative polysaccharide biosynthesis protein n=1 Tax=Oceanobacillus TaxID=182709 RepID=UPI00084E5EF3|nr:MULTISPECIES: polysaccharide biosynthesis protein [Oceanobacillus]MBT2600698.1 polysaccharide biosynthesis protein [Oceanobacillus sp. ISL-74]MBT2650905.1 polysaccharide biosynthesis protein [Oceanobacillus sp. ISL-73]OEH55271.1 cell division protein [Oceanobacillus sp. E9]
MSKMVRGTMLLSGASFLSKFLGMIFVIPFYAIVGDAGGTLFAYAYTPYSIFISLSTVGIPLAVSKFVSKYNSLGDYETGMRMFKAGSTLMLFTGLVAFIVMFSTADWIASLQIRGDNSAITSDDVAYVIRMVSFALIIIPAMSIVRGFFQGHQSMGPTAVSQVIEQIVRILFILGGSYVIVFVLGGSKTTAVGFSAFAALLGALASCVILFLYWKKRKSHLQKQIDAQRYTYDLKTKDLFKELFRYAGPFVLVGLAIPLYQLVDQFTFEPAMNASGREDEWILASSVIMNYGHKIIIIPMTIATGLSLAMLPSLTEAFTKNKRETYTKLLNQALQVILVLVVPASAGIAMLSGEIYGSLFTMDDLGARAELMAWYAPVALLFGFITVTAGMLQGIDQQNYAVISLLTGLLVKILLNNQFIHLFGGKGAILGTALAALIAVIMNLWRLKTTIDFSFKQTIKRTMLITIFTAVMCVVILMLKLVLGIFLPFQEERWAAIVMLIFGVTVGGGVYLLLAYKSTLLEHVFDGKIPLIGRFMNR